MNRKANAIRIRKNINEKKISHLLHHGVAQDDEGYCCVLLVILLSFGVVGTYENIAMLPPPRPFFSPP
jgi:hypothetical protein